MAIKGLTSDRVRRRDTTAGLPLLGVIHKGAKRTEEDIARKRPGMDLKYFRIAFTERFARLETDMRRIYKAEPTEFDTVCLFGHTPEEAFPNWRIWRTHNGQRIGRRCDGEQQQFWLDKNLNAHSVENGAEPLACIGGGDHGGCAECGYSGELKLFFPQLLNETGVMGFFLFQTSSQRDIGNIDGVLHKIGDFGIDLESVTFRFGREEEHAGWRPYKDKQTGEAKVAELRKSFIYLEPTGAITVRLGALLAARVDALSLPDGTRDSAAGMTQGAALLTESVGSGVSSVQERTADVSEGEWVEPAQNSGDEGDLGATLPYDLCHSVYMQQDKGGAHFSYILRCDDARNFTVYNGNLFRACGYDPEQLGWKVKGKVVKFEPSLRVYLNDKGEVERLTPGAQQEILIP